jgi:hypothetical protein
MSSVIVLYMLPKGNMYRTITAQEKRELDTQRQELRERFLPTSEHSRGINPLTCNSAEGEDNRGSGDGLQHTLTQVDLEASVKFLEIDALLEQIECSTAFWEQSNNEAGGEAEGSGYTELSEVITYLDQAESRRMGTRGHSSPGTRTEPKTNQTPNATPDHGTLESCYLPAIALTALKIRCRLPTYH